MRVRRALEKFAKWEEKCSCPSCLKCTGAFYKLGGDRITMNLLLLRQGQLTRPKRPQPEEVDLSGSVGVSTAFLSVLECSWRHGG
jgi:hypothetical protein